MEREREKDGSRGEEIKENIWQGDLQLWRNVPLLLEQKQQR